MLKFFSTHKVSILSVLLMAAAAVLGADGSFAMAVEIAGTESGGEVTPDVQTEATLRAAAQEDTQGLDTQLQGKSTTATDARDAKLEAEDIDPKVARFRPFRFPIEWYIANKCQQVKSKSYEHTHFRSGATVLEDTTNDSLTFAKATVSVACSKFENLGAALTECSQVFVPGVDGYAADGTTVDGDLSLYVVSNDDENVKLVALNPKGSGSITVPAGTKFVVAATACSESQMLVAPESYLPEADTLFLQKKIANVIITDEWKEQAKKVEFITRDVLHNGLYNFKRKCARTHWLGRQGRLDVKVKELNGNREATYFERGILRQIPNVLPYNGKAFSLDDFMAMTRMQFAKNSENNYAVAFCGLNAHQRIQAFAYNTSVHNGSIKFEEVTEMGINVSRWHDSLGTLEIVYDPTLDDIGREDDIAIIDIQNAVRYYKRNEKQEKQDMKTSGEHREAERTIISMIDCIGLKGYNAVLVTPASKLADALKLGGVSNIIEPIGADVNSTSGLDQSKMYYLGHAVGSFPAGVIIKYNGSAWVEFDGNLSAA